MTYPFDMSSRAHQASRTSLAAILAAALVLGFAALTSAGPAAAVSPTDTVAGPNRAKATLDKVVAAFDTEPGARTAPRTTPLPRSDVTLLLRDLRLALPSLSRTDRATAETYLARSSVGEGCTGTVIRTARFCIHYETNTGLFGNADAATQEQAESTAATFEHVYGRIVTNLRYRAPLNDGDGLFDVYLENLGSQGIYGFCQTDDNTPTSSSFCKVDNDFSTAEYGAPPLNSLRVTAAHEFFHAVQFAYDAQDDTWFLEGTAVWVEDIVYPAINDYLQYLPVSQLQRPRQSLDFIGNLERYGSVIFWKFLSERFRDNNIIRQVWNAAAASSGSRNGIGAVGAVLRARGFSFGPVFARYGVWNTLPPGTYADRALWPSPVAVATRVLSSQDRDIAYSVPINHRAHAPVVFRVGSGIPLRTKLRVVVDGPDRSRGAQATVQIRFRDGTVTTYTLPLSASGYSSTLYGFNPRFVKSAIVVLTNSGGFNNQPFKVRAKLVF